MTQQIASTTAIVLGFLVFLLLGGRLIRYFGLAAEGKLDVSLLFTIVGYNLPFFLELILPLAFFIALMLVFGRLYVDHEMAVINSSGISRGQLARFTIPLIVVLFVCEAWLSILGKPWGVRHSESIWQQQAMQSAFDLIRPGEFLNSGDYHLYVGSLDESVSGNTKLQNVILIQTNTSKGSTAKNTNGTDATSNNLGNQLDAQLDNELENRQANTETPTTNASRETESTPEELKNLPTLPRNLHSKDTIILAKLAQQVKTDPTSGKSQLDLFNGRRYEIGANSKKYNQVSFDRYRITLTQEKKDTVDETNTVTSHISSIWKTATASAQPNLPAQAELGYRLSLPWLIIIAPMLAVPLAQVRPRQGRWLRLIPAIVIFVIVAMGIISLKKPVSNGKVSVWANLWFIIVVMGLALYMNWSSRIHQRIRFQLNNQSKKTQPKHLADNTDIDSASNKDGGLS